MRFFPDLVIYHGDCNDGFCKGNPLGASLAVYLDNGEEVYRCVIVDDAKREREVLEGALKKVQKEAAAKARKRSPR